MKKDIQKFTYDLCIIGGAGHVGLPFGVVAANRGIKTVLLDTNASALKKIKNGVFPFKEDGGERELKSALKKKTLFVSAAPESITQSAAVILVTGTPVNEYLSPDLKALFGVINNYLSYFCDGQVLILRSTLYPGTTEKIQNIFNRVQKMVHVVFCPERITQGYAIKELAILPQIVSGFDVNAVAKTKRLFRKITSAQLIDAKPQEAELAKLFSNAWRYIKFAVANQFFMIASDHDFDYRRIDKIMRQNYSRNNDLPLPGFAAGPCLLKDTMQLVAFHSNNFSLGHAAMLINEGLPNHVIKTLKRNLKVPAFQPHPEVLLASTNRLTNILQQIEHPRKKNVGILGMSFKAESDDPRDSLSYKLKRLAETEFGSVLCHDPYIKDKRFVGLDTLLTKSDIVILATPHEMYKKIDPKKYRDKMFVDIWHFWDE